jgi:hypothetical protein
MTTGTSGGNNDTSNSGGTIRLCATQYSRSLTIVTKTTLIDIRRSWLVPPLHEAGRQSCRAQEVARRNRPGVQRQQRASCELVPPRDDFLTMDALRAAKALHSDALPLYLRR